MIALPSENCALDPAVMAKMPELDLNEQLSAIIESDDEADDPKPSSDVS